MQLVNDNAAQQCDIMTQQFVNCHTIKHFINKPSTLENEILQSVGR